MTTYNATEDVFVGSQVQVLKLAMKAIQVEGYKIEDANESLGFITFSTGMTWNSFSGASCTISFSEIQAGRFKASGAGKQKPSGLFRMSVDLTGEANSIANKVISRMKKIAPAEDATPKTNSEPAPEVKILAVEDEVRESIARINRLKEEGVITEEEYKAKRHELLKKL
jgi:hypothetical protein